jgi:hypothetical protein
MVLFYILLAFIKSWKRSLMPGQPAKPPPKKTNIGGDELPFRVQSDPIVGYRLWRVKSTPDGYGLFSLNMPYEWKPVNTAECLKMAVHPMIPMIPGKIGVHDDPAPSLSCQCGFYIMLEDAPITEWDHTIRGQVHAYGTVELSGRVIKCTMGYKAEHAEIVSVMVDAACGYRNDSGPCEANVAFVDPQLRAFCPAHVPGEITMVDAQTAMENVRSRLEIRYPEVEVMSWLI